MENTPQRKSIFRILISRIFLFLIIFNVLFGAYIIIDEIKTENKFKEAKAQALISEVGNMLIFVNKNLITLEQIYRNRQKKIAIQLEKKVNDLNCNKLNVNELMFNLNFDTTTNHVNFIKDGIIINSSDAQEIGTNILTVLNPSDSAYFQDQIMNGTVFPSKFFYSKKDQQFRVLAFYPVLQNKLIIGVNSFSPEFDIIKELFKFRLKEMALENKTVSSINLWFHFIDQRIPLLTDGLNQIVIDHINGPLISKDSVFITINEKGKVLGIKHVFEESRKNIYNFKGLSISIISDYTKEYDTIKLILRNRIILLLFAFFVFFIIIYFSTRGLKLTLADLLEKTAQIGLGNLNKRVLVLGNNEFTTLSEHFNRMVENIESAHNELKNKNEEILAQRDEIITQRDEIEAQRNIAIEQRDIIEKQKTSILDSIRYAKKIQEAVLPEKEYILQVLPESFIYYKPCSVVSGDFYWIKEQGDKLIIVAADCTGHGVPGAFMSMLGAALLNEIVIREKITQPNLILNELRKKIKYALKQTGKDNEAQDGMDMTICSMDRNKMILQYAAAMNPLVLIRNNEVTVLEADSMPVGIYYVEKDGFTHHELTMEVSDTFYMFSDGYTDQIGGPNKRRFMSQNFRNLLLEISSQSLEYQLEMLDKTFMDWKDGKKQLDDVLVLGFKVF